MGATILHATDAPKLELESLIVDGSIVPFGPELLVNGDFSDGDTGWTLDTGATFNTDRLTILYDGNTNPIASIPVTFEVGKIYKVEAHYANISAGCVPTIYFTGAYEFDLVVIDGVMSFFIKANDTNGTLTLDLDSYKLNDQFDFLSASIKEAYNANIIELKSQEGKPIFRYSGEKFSSVSLGDAALSKNTTGRGLTAVGSRALANNTTGDRNTAFGSAALSYNVNGNYNVAVGAFTLLSNIDGYFNVAVGEGALYYSRTGLNNTAVGRAAGGSNVTGSGNTFIGSDTTQTIQSTNSTAIGIAATITKSNQVVLGGAGVVETVLRGDLVVDKTITAGGTTGAQTINKTSGSVNFAASAASLVVTNNHVTANSVIICTVGTNDSTMKSVQAVAGSGSFTLYPNANPTAETRVNFLVLN